VSQQVAKDSAGKSYDVAIVGAGLVGGSLALALAAQGLQVALIDAEAQSSFATILDLPKSVHDYSPRVSALSPSSQNLLTEIGAWPHLDSGRVQAYQDMYVWDELGTEKISFHAGEYRLDALGFIVENPALVAAIHTEISNVERVDLLAQHRVQMLSQHDQGVVIKLVDGTDHALELTVPLLVGADGARSQVRQLADFETREWDYDHHAIVCTVELAQPHQRCSKQRFAESGPLAFLPLNSDASEKHMCSIVWSVKPDIAKQLLALEEIDFLRQLEKAGESEVGRLLACSTRFSVPLRQRHVKRYMKKNVVLVGDAAHTIHPLAGQGVNLGLKDIAVLSDVLGQAFSDDIALNHPLVLKRYQRQRQFDNLSMAGAMEAFKRLFETPNPLVRLVRNVGMSMVDRHTLIKEQVVRRAMGL
jgi:2-octaprenylphenol hydroxylase